ncbi:MAG: L-glutamate gamma-semialdehyde dehydrogenase [Synergistales bacterium]|nr:L-glutamate gamma-semialdehyde dehydrogenase [Synergistales bacterium]
MWNISKPLNESDRIFSYSPGSLERQSLVEALEKISSQAPYRIPLIIGGREVWTENEMELRCPHDHSLILARCSLAGEREIELAIETSLHAWKTWSVFPWSHRSAIFQKAADLLANNYRYRNIAAIMMNLSKNPYEAEIDLAELVDFWRYNSFYLNQIYSLQPEQGNHEFNRFDWRPLEGPVLAVSPFNFYSIGGNLPTAPAICGNVVLWKPSSSALFSNFEIISLLQEAGLPPGVINFIPFSSSLSGKIFQDPFFSGLHFTGSYDTFINLQKEIARNMSSYRSFPRVVGETGGKDFVMIHASADPQEAATGIIRGGFGYQGQKCSAASRVYASESLWDDIFHIIKGEWPRITVGPVNDLDNYMGAVISEESFRKVTSYIEYAAKSPDAEILIGGGYDDRRGWFIEPTVIETKDPDSPLLREEIFGPVVTVYVYRDVDFEKTLQICDKTTRYALTGSIFADNREAICQAERILRFAAGNFYINDKPTGAIVGRQPFGGSRHSGTNDKAGFYGNLMRWLSPRNIKETTLPPDQWGRPFMGG